MVSSLLARCIIVTIGTLYPGYRSYKSLINADLREVVNCLRYWIVFSIFIACETVTDVLLSWFPFYYWIKILIVLWMSSLTGSTLLYKRFVQPVLKEREQEIDQLLEQSKQKGYSALLDLTNKGFRYASGIFLNTAVLGQAYLGEHLKRSLSTSDIVSDPNKPFKNPHATLYEEDEEVDQEFSKRLKEDRKYLTKESKSAIDQRLRSPQQVRPLDTAGVRLEEMKPTAKVTTVKQRAANKPNTVTYSSNESAHIGTISKRQMMKTKEAVKTPSVKPPMPVEQETKNADETDDDRENLPERT